MQTDVLDQLFFKARTHHHWLDKPVPLALLHQLYEATKMGPTSVNSGPARFVFITSQESKQKLVPALAPGNVEQTLHAPVTIIVGMDLAFYEHLPQLFPHADARSWFVGNAEFTATTALRNSSLQGAYLILAARALGLDCGAMSGFDNQKVDEAFFVGTQIRSNFLLNIGYGDASKLYPPGPRLDFATACQVI
jgi:3-hydroxypropanoate dehydrogenase